MLNIDNFFYLKDENFFMSDQSPNFYFILVLEKYVRKRTINIALFKCIF